MVRQLRCGSRRASKKALNVTHYRVALLLIVALCLLPSRACADVSAATLLKGYEISTGVDRKDLCQSIEAFVYGVSWANAFIKKTGSGAPLLRTRKNRSAGRSAHRYLTQICGGTAGDEQASMDCSHHHRTTGRLPVRRALGRASQNFAKLIAEETEKWSEVIRTAHIKPD
jgi:hypothetical protein